MYDNNYPNDYTNNSANSNTDSEQSGSRQGGSYGQSGIDYRPYQNTGNRTENAYGQNTSQNPYGTHSAYQGSAGSYQYSSGYPNSYMQHSEQKKEKKHKEKKQGGYFKKVLVAVSLGLFFGLFAGLGLYIVDAASGMTKRDRVAVLEETGDLPQTQAEASGESVPVIDESLIKQSDTATTVITDVTDVVKNVMPAIVAVNNHYTETMSFFGQDMSSEADASGSGIIVGQNDSELLIVTNHHVVEDTDKLTVQFNEGSEAEAFIKGQDAKMDLAVIAVPVTELSSSTLDAIVVATLGDSDALVVGEPAIAIGNSLGYGQSVTTGVISALDRSINISSSGYGGDNVEGTFIQTDAAINPGNSGGALLNIKGEVIGINSNKIGGSAVEGMGYAIPISSASPIIAELMLKETKSKVAEDERGYLGISGISVTQEVSRAYGMPEGVYIAQVYENTAAAGAGLKQGDIITEFGGDKIASMEELQKELEFYAKGDTVDVKVMTMTVAGYEEVTRQLVLGNKVTE